MSDLSKQIRERHAASFQNLSVKRALWDDVEKLFHNQLQDQLSHDKAKSQVFDPVLSTSLIERSYRVMSQMASGKVKGISENDVGDALLKNLILEKYIIPNANAQFDFLTKARMVNMYSNLYGIFYALIDLDVRKNGYIGPDMWLLNIRDVFPQVGAVSLDDSEHVIVRTWKPLSFFEGLKTQDGFKNVGKVVEKLTQVRDARMKRTSNDKSKREEQQYPSQSTGPDGYFEVLTQYERDRWIDLAVDADLEFRDQDNPQEDDELPVVAKYSIPLLDDPSGMGDVERGRSMQMVVNSNWNLYLDAVKTSIAPPILIDKSKIADNGSMKMIPGAKWLFKGDVNGAAMPMNLSPQGIQTFNTVNGVAKAALLNLMGTSTTQTTQQTDPGFGRTPQALEMQQARENTRDNADRFYQEQFIVRIMKKFVNIMNKKQSSAITIRMFKDEVADLARSYPEIKDSYDEATGKLTIKKGKNSMLYDYEIVSGSTYAADQKQQQQNMGMLVDLFQKSQTPQGNLLVAQLKQDGYEFNFGELLKRIVANSGIQDWDKILTEMTEGERTDHTLGTQMQQFQAAIQNMMGAPNQTPAQPIDASGQTPPPQPQPSQPMQQPPPGVMQ